ncbi:MAG TPA: NADH-quinone oxidoreductase subunit J [Anaerolineales bacterium]|nr:NADH-quinone oxidoreductase subunit J [Anaerolineales bacterium]HRF47201.1 NADH-quinone oxidoreductase subunit J [Anaerolineales bacterium]
MTLEWILFFALAAIAVLSALGMLRSRNAVHAAMYLVANFAVVALFYLLLNAPFIAMVQVTVYAGAIMVLFVFVIMLLGAERLSDESQALPLQGYLAWTAGGIVALTLVLVVYQSITTGQAPLPTTAVPADFGSPAAIGQLMYGQATPENPLSYVLPFEVTSLLLLVGMIGAVVLTRDALTRGREKR